MRGGPGTAIQIDETCFTRRKHNRAGFGGRITQGHQIKILGFIEIDLETRQSIGRTFLVIIPNLKRPTIEAQIRARCMPGAIIWTDGFARYKWLGRAESPFWWSFVNHSQREFSRQDYPHLVTTNGLESLIGRLKKFCRD